MTGRSTAVLGGVTVGGPGFSIRRCAEEVSLVAEFRPDDVRAFDAIVGSFEEVRDGPIAEDRVVHRLAVFVDGSPDADTMGLADDVRLLIEAFVRDPAAVARDLPPAAPTPDGDPGEDVDIALHGLDLGPEDQGVLCRLIRDLVRERRALRGARG